AAVGGVGLRSAAGDAGWLDPETSASATPFDQATFARSAVAVRPGSRNRWITAGWRTVSCGFMGRKRREGSLHERSGASSLGRRERDEEKQELVDAVRCEMRSP